MQRGTRRRNKPTQPLPGTFDAVATVGGLLAVNSDHIDSESAPDRDESAVVHCRVVLSSQEGWDVLVERGQSVMSTSHCTDWHRVERVRAASRRRY